MGFQDFIPLILIFAIMYFLLIRPQQKKVKQHQNMVASLRRGDQVVTQGGLMGKVTKVKEENEIDKVFRASDGLTVTEVLAEATEPVFKNTWSEKNTGVTRNKAKGAGANASVAGAPTPAPTTSLFAKKAQ